MNARDEISVLYSFVFYKYKKKNKLKENDLAVLLCFKVLT